MAQKSSIRILHIGDVHLDSPFSGVDVREGDARRTLQREALLNALSLATEKGSDMILISGDLFDCGYVTEETVKTVLSAIEKTKLPVILSPGNHDSYTPDGIYARKNLPDNLYVFTSEEMGRYDFDELRVSVHGYAFLSNRYFSDPLEGGYQLREGYINLLCAHTELDEAIPKFAPIKRARLEGSGFVYAALGHDHIHRPPVTAGGTTYAYSGFLFGRSFDELGFGRGLIVDIDRESGETQVEAVRLAHRRYEIEELDISGAETESDVIGAVSALVSKKGYGRETSLRIILRGAVSPELTLPHLGGGELSLSLLQLKDETIPAFDEEFLKNDITLKGALYRRLESELRCDDPYRRRVAAEALRIGLCALDGKSFI